MQRIIQVEGIASFSTRIQWAVIIFLSIIVIAIGMHGAGLGLGHDVDSRAIFEKSVPAILKWSYVPGRSYGNPLYEFFAALLYAIGGIVLTNLYSLVLAIASIALFYHLLDRPDGWSRLFAMVGFCLSPVFLTNAYAFGEWMQTFFFTLCLLWAASRWLETSSCRDLAFYATFSMLLVLTRPDAAFICVCLCISLLWQLRFQLHRSVELIIASTLAGALTVTIMVVINGGFGFMQGLAFDNNNTWLRSFYIATLGVCTLFGFPGVIVAFGCAALLVWRLCKGSYDPISFWSKLFLVCIVIGFLRYVVLPQKLEYVFYLLISALLMMTHENISRIWVALFSISVILPTFFVLSIFQRNGFDDHLYIQPHIDDSAILQDWITSEADWKVMDASFLQQVAKQVYSGEPEPLPQLSTTTWGPGLVSDKGDLLIGALEGYRLDNPRSGDLYRRDKYRRIYICDKSMFHGSPGWRFLERPVPRPSLDSKTGKVDVRCALEDRATVLGSGR